MQGIRCSGCSRWFHDTCAPSPVAEAHALGSEHFFHCESCRLLRTRLLDEATCLTRAAVQAAGQAAASTAVEADREAEEATSQSKEPTGLNRELQNRSGGEQSSTRTFTLIDLSLVRGSLEPKAASQGPAIIESKASVASPKFSLEKAKNGEGNPFQKKPKYLRLVDQQLAEAGKVEEKEMETSISRREMKELQAMSSVGLKDMKSLANIFGPAEMEAILEDDFGVLVRNHKGRAVAAASFNLLGADAETGHARLMSLLTEPDLQGLETVLASAGVPRLVVMYPRNDEDQKSYVDGLLRRRMHYKELEIPDLVAYKAAPMNLYHRDFVSGNEFVVKDLPAVTITELHDKK
eukprot:gene23921-9492_t